MCCQVNVANKIGDTALHGAAWKGQAEIVGLLLEKGADRDQVNGDGQKAYDLARKSPETQQLLSARSASAAAAQAARYGADDDEDSD